MACWRVALPCGGVLGHTGTGSQCEAHFRCGPDGQYLIRWRCHDNQRPGGQGQDVNHTMCPPSRPPLDCPPPVVCPGGEWKPENAQLQAETFPTELVIGGTLGALSLVALLLLLLAGLRRWQLRKRYAADRDYFLSLRFPHRARVRQGLCGGKKPRFVPMFGDPVWAYDLALAHKMYRGYDNMATDVYFPTHSTPRGLRACMDSSDHAAMFTADDSRSEPSIIAGSFIYHPPTNLPPHFAAAGPTHGFPGHAHNMNGHAPTVTGHTPNFGDHAHNLSYDSFKAEHMTDQRGVASSTLQRPPDFYL